ncbi:MAG: hypothetical protein AAFX06_02130 [Planctomycetota bacterium]
MKRATLFLVFGFALIGCLAMAYEQAPAEQAASPIVPSRLEGKFCVYTVAPNHSQTWILDPVVVTIGDQAFLKGESLDGSASYIALRHVGQLLKLEPEDTDQGV